jgi:hypothetical protein
MGIHRPLFSSFSSFGNRKGDCNLNAGMKRHWHRCAALFLTAKKRAQAIHPPWSIHITERGRDVPHYYWMGLINCVVVVVAAFKKKTNSRRYARVSFVNFRDSGA